VHCVAAGVHSASLWLLCNRLALLPSALVISTLDCGAIGQHCGPAWCCQAPFQASQGVLPAVMRGQDLRVEGLHVCVCVWVCGGGGGGGGGWWWWRGCCNLASGWPVGSSQGREACAACLHDACSRVLHTTTGVAAQPNTLAYHTQQRLRVYTGSCAAWVCIVDETSMFVWLCVCVCAPLL
jgi:hypothetical protein